MGTVLKTIKGYSLNDGTVSTDYKQGDMFVVADDKGLFKLGSKVKLVNNDGTINPKFELVEGEVNGGYTYATVGFIAWSRLSKLVIPYVPEEGDKAYYTLGRDKSWWFECQVLCKSDSNITIRCPHLISKDSDNNGIQVFSLNNDDNGVYPVFFKPFNDLEEQFKKLPLGSSITENAKIAVAAGWRPVGDGECADVVYEHMRSIGWTTLSLQEICDSVVDNFIISKRGDE